MSSDAPPAYAWDWFTRQRLLWQEARVRLAEGRPQVANRYSELETRPEVVARLRGDYAEIPEVRQAVDAVVRELAFLDRTGEPFERVASSTAPRGMRWWWAHLSGDEVPPAPPRAPARAAIPDTQLALGDVLSGYGDGDGSSGSSRRNRVPGSSGS